MPELKTVYECDPSKAVECPKTNCFKNPNAPEPYSHCHGTTHTEWAALDKMGNPILFRRESEAEKRPWYETPPPEWYRKMGHYGILVNLLISIIALIVAILRLR